MQVPTEIKTIKAIYDQIIFITIEKIMTKIRESFYSGLKNVTLLNFRIWPFQIVNVSRLHQWTDQGWRHLLHDFQSSRWYFV